MKLILVPDTEKGRLWELLSKGMLPDLLMSIFQSLGAYDKFTEMLEKTLEKINIEIEKTANAPKCDGNVLFEATDDEIKTNREKLKKAIDVICKVLPDTTVTKLLPTLNRLSDLPAAKLEQVLRGFMQDCPKLVITALQSAVTSMPTDDLPVTPAEIEQASKNRLNKFKNDEVKFEEEAAKIADSISSPILKALDDSWLGTLLGWLLRPIIKWVLGKAKGSMAKNAETVRLNLTKTPILANIFYKAGRDLMKRFP